MKEFYKPLKISTTLQKLKKIQSSNACKWILRDTS